MKRMKFLLAASVSALAIVAAVPADATLYTSDTVFTAPADGYYQIIASGAQGGKSSNASGGWGAVVGATVFLYYGTDVHITIGAQGGESKRGGAGGGGASTAYAFGWFIAMGAGGGGAGGTDRGTSGRPSGRSVYPGGGAPGHGEGGTGGGGGGGGLLGAGYSGTGQYPGDGGPRYGAGGAGGAGDYAGGNGGRGYAAGGGGGGAKEGFGYYGGGGGGGGMWGGPGGNAYYNEGYGFGTGGGGGWSGLYGLNTTLINEVRIFGGYASRFDRIYGAGDGFVSIELIPEPASMGLFGLSLAGLALARRRRR